jgi:hypothetical protein
MRRSLSSACSACRSASSACRSAAVAKALQVGVLNAEWICRADRQAEIEQRKADDARRTAATAKSNWERDRAEALAAIALLPPAIQAELAAIAGRGPGGLRLSPEAPFYVIQLVRAYKAWFSRTLP